MMSSKGRKVPESKRNLFKKPLGIDISESELSKLDCKRMLITVGDVVSLVVKDYGITPTLSIYDGMTERREMTEFAAFVKDNGLEELVVRNDAGTISAELITAIKNALGESVRIIRVKGEEDLATLPCILLAPLGSYIIYGWPGVGMKLITTDREIQNETKLLIEQMEELE